VLLTVCLFALLQVECSSLTGESDLVPASVDRKHDIPAEARNLVFMSSLAMNGEGRGIVIRTGEVAGTIALCSFLPFDLGLVHVCRCDIANTPVCCCYCR
jgi:hypothetical protein